MTEPLLRTTHLNKHFGGITATDNVNLNVEPGQIHAIIGPNGAGKTTLLAQLSGQLKPDSGQIHFAGQNITQYSMAQRAQLGLARSFQIISIIPPMTLLENVMLAVQARSGHSFRFWTAVKHDQAMRDTAMATLTKMGLADRAYQIAAQVSYGEQRQLEVTMALAMKPRLLLLDEPMAGLGKENSSQMINTLKRLQRLQGDKALLLVEHDMDAVFQMADSISVLVNGRVIATDTVENIRSHPEVQKAYLGDYHEQNPA